MKKYKLSIDGMHCAACASNAERALRGIKGVKEVGVSVLTKKGIVEAEDSVNQDDLKKAVDRIGYKVVKIEVAQQ